MLLKLRVALPDRAGALGKVTRVFGAAGADVLQMIVLEREAGRAVDEFTVMCAHRGARDRLIDGIAALPGVSLEGIWPTTTVPDAHPELDLLAQIAANPLRAVETLVDAVPRAVSADWAVVVHNASRQITYSSPAAPVPLISPDVRPLRATAFAVEGGVRFAAAPIRLADEVLFVARELGPSFHRVELARLARLVEVARTIAVAKGAAALLG